MNVQLHHEDQNEVIDFRSIRIAPELQSLLTS